MARIIRLHHKFYKLAKVCVFAGNEVPPHDIGVSFPPLCKLLPRIGTLKCTLNNIKGCYVYLQDKSRKDK